MKNSSILAKSIGIFVSFSKPKVVYLRFYFFYHFPNFEKKMLWTLLSKTESVKFHWFSVKFHWLESWEVSHWESVKMYRFIQWKCYHWLDEWKRLNESVLRITDWISEINHSLNYWLKNLRVLKKYFKWTLLQVAMEIFYYEIKQFIRNKNVMFHFI